MCGLVGIAGDIKVEHLKIFRTLLLLNTSRGWDSTGVLNIPRLKSAPPKIAKAIGTPYDLFMLSREFDAKGIVHGQPKVLLGHNRYATLGQVTVDNAHPFQFGDIIGAHNGTLRDWADLVGYKEHHVDSKALLQHISERGVEDAWKNFAGAAAITWWDSGSEELNLIRNKERPLSIAYANEGSLVLWASEGWMIEAAIICCPSVKLDGALVELEPHTLFTFKLDGVTPGLPSKKKLEAKKGHPVAMGFTPPSGLRRSRPINFGWAKDALKGPKELVGKTFKLYSSFTRYYDSTPTYVLSGKLESGERIEVYAESYSEWDEFSDAILDNQMKDNVYEIKSRPRLLREGPGKALYGISSSNIDLREGFEYVNFFDRHGQACSRIVAKNDLDAVAGGRCSCCDKSLTVDDKYEYIYNGFGVLCDDCNSNDTLKGMMGI